MSPKFHQICSSDFVREEWINLLLMAISITEYENDWHVMAPGFFRLLSNLCGLAEKLTSKEIQRFLSRRFITRHTLPEDIFINQITTTFEQFKRSISIDFNLLVNVIRLILQTDQPLTIPKHTYANLFYWIPQTGSNQGSSSRPYKVSDKHVLTKKNK